MTETVHEEFLRRVLEEVKTYFSASEGESKAEDKELLVYKYPIVCPDYCKKLTDWDRLENLVDVEDGFLMKAFQPLFTEPKTADNTEKPSLFEQ